MNAAARVTEEDVLHVNMDVGHAEQSLLAWVKGEPRTENSAILAMDGYFHRHSWFWLNPWLDRISFSCRLHCSAQTYRHAVHTVCFGNTRTADGAQNNTNTLADRLTTNTRSSLGSIKLSVTMERRRIRLQWKERKQAGPTLVQRGHDCHLI